MKKNIKKIIAIGLISSSICMLPLTGASANARWRNDGVGWWYMQDDGHYTTGWVQTNGKWYYLGDSGYMKTGWQQDNGKWYYLNNDGSMATNTNIGGYQIDNNGVWVQNTTNNTTNTVNTNSNNTTNINNGVINNTNVTNNVYVNGNNQASSPTGMGATPNSNISPSSNNNSVNKTMPNTQDGWIKVDDNHYKYYENGQALTNTWKKFDEGYRHFDKEGYMSLYNTDGLKISEKGVIPLTQKYPYTTKQIFRDLKPYNSRGTVFISGNLDYIKQTYDIFGIKYKIEYQDVYDKKLDGEIISIGDHFINFDDNDEGKFDAEKIIEIAEYQDRLGLN